MTDAPQLKLYNTLSRKKENFEPIDADNVRIYVCGPTVYDYAHIGNARPVIVFDVLFRLLRHIYGKDKVTYVRNITDVDDKINARALRDYPDLPLNEAIRQVTEKTTVQFHDDVKALGCLEPTHEPRATGHIDGMIKMIEVLIGKGNAYEAGGEVLFDVSSMPEYGRLSNRKIEDQQAGARVATSSHKKNPGDFVLWKQSSKDEPGWQSPWGTGRPGWHLECSVMSEHHLGKTFDIHGGGLDLIFPHHENEIAQSRCAHGNDKMANYWMHNGYLQVEGKKMSKSDGNFVTIKDLLETDKFGGRKWPGEVLRLAMLMTHYREPIDFSVRRLEEAENRLKNWRRHAALMSVTQISQIDRSIQDSLSNDMDFSAAFSRIDELAKGNQTDKSTVDVTSALHFLGLQQSAEEAVDVLNSITENAEYRFKYYVRDQLLDRTETESFYLVWEQIDANNAIEQRQVHITNKDWEAADKIRDLLTDNGAEIKDSKDPDTGERITRWEVKR